MSLAVYCNNFMHFSMFVGDDVNLTTNYEGARGGPCPDTLIVVSCSVIGPTLRWNVTDTSLELTSSSLVIFFAVSQDVGNSKIISTSTINITFYQNDTVQSSTHPSTSIIYSEMHFHLNVDEFVNIKCMDHDQNSKERKVRPLSMCVLL